MAEDAFEEDRIMQEAQPGIVNQDPSRRMLTISADPASDTMRKVMRELASEGDLAAQQTNPREN